MEVFIFFSENHELRPGANELALRGFNCGVVINSAFHAVISGQSVVIGCYEFNYRKRVKGVGSGACTPDVQCSLIQVTSVLCVSVSSPLKYYIDSGTVVRSESP